MKTLAPTLLLFLMISLLHGQNLEGQWEGALSVQGKQIRLVLHVDKNNNQYSATLDSPDQNGRDIEVTNINFNYPNVKFEISSLAAMYEGTLASKDITGKWLQSGTALFLVFSRKETVAAGK